MNINNQDIYYDKYIKYKNKYLELKELKELKELNGGGDYTDPNGSGVTIPWFCKPYSKYNPQNWFKSYPNFCKIYNNNTTFQLFHDNLKNNLIKNLRLDFETKKNIVDEKKFTNLSLLLNNNETSPYTILNNLNTILNNQQNFNIFINTELVGMLYQYEISKIINLYFYDAYNYYEKKMRIT